ncbi:MAG: hypothetical protein LBU44_04655 [Mediterranea sp.]|jgi:hypothetical protein|nr:hypothetical protein [Mediterranea sp.]
MFVVCCIPLLLSCNKAEELLPAKNLVTFKLMLPGDEEQDLLPVSRSGVEIGGTEDETGIRTLRFLIYNNTGAIEAYKCIEIRDDWTSPDAMWNVADKSLNMLVTVGEKKIYCIANWDITPTEEMPRIDETTAPTVAELLQKVRVHRNVTPANPPVMTGFITEKIDNIKQNFKIQLKRQVARVELSSKISEDLSLLGANVSITGVMFANLPTHAYVFPQTSLSSPTPNEVWDQTAFVGDTLALTKDAAMYGTTYYIPEYAPGNKPAATVMIVRTNYNGKTVYYSVVLDPSVSKAHPHKAYVIERNHTYLYNLTLFGIGAATNTARNAKTRVDDTQMNDTVITYELEIK